MTQSLIQTRVDRPSLTVLEEYAKSRDRSVSWLVRNWVRNGLAAALEESAPLNTRCNPDGIPLMQLFPTLKAGRPRTPAPLV